MIDCQSYEGCSAPLCPLMADLLPRAVWYSDEEVCRKKGATRLYPWVKLQRRISRLPAKDRGYFTQAMLAAIGRVSGGIVGIRPDTRGDKQDEEQRWIAQRKRHIPTPEEVERLRAYARRALNPPVAGACSTSDGEPVSGGVEEPRS